jgi:DNA invertase Pin-like site-specific DNA recombinase
MIGIYSRQSVEKQDSVSIEAQIDTCKKICNFHNEQYEIYQDVGFSGSNINRPSFERLLSDIQAGKIKKVVAYRLDRISRNIKDFSDLLTLFEKYNVSFISATENIDTSTPMGRAMIYIIMVFIEIILYNI